MIDVYHGSTGRNCMFVLNFTPNRDGLVPARYAARYKALGDFIRSCYGAPIATGPGECGCDKTGRCTCETYYLTPVAVDRVVLREDQSAGQLIRTYTVEARINNVWSRQSNGTSVGNKRIDIWQTAQIINALRITVTAIDMPKFEYDVYLCGTYSSDILPFDY